MGARHLLYGLLLGFDGFALCRGCYEHSLDRRADAARLFGENASFACASKFRYRIVALWVGRIRSFSRLMVSSRSSNNDESDHKSRPRSLDGVRHVLGNSVAVDFGIRSFRRGPGSRLEK